MNQNQVPGIQPVSSPWARHHTLRALLAILAVWTIAASIWPLTGMVVPWDSKNHFYPMLRYLGAALAHGELPLWNPYHFSGHPAVADPQSLIFTPTMVLFGWLVPQPSMELFDAFVFGHFLPGALAFVPLFRRRGWHPAGAVLAAVIFILGGSATARLQHTGMIISYGFFPLALWHLEEALERRSYRFGVTFAVIAALMTVGRDQVAFLSAVTLVGVVIHQAWTSPASWAYLMRRVALLLTMALVGGALLAVPSLLTMQLLATSTRPSFGYGVAAMGSLPPGSLATVLFGNVFGSLHWSYDYWGPDGQSLAEGTWTDRATNYLFVGTIPALLVFWHGIAGGRLLAREFRFFLVVGLLAILYALGRYTPGFEMIFDHFPGVKLYRRPADATFLINVVFAFAAGYLVHRFVKEGHPRLALDGGWRRAVLPALAVALAGAAVASALTFAAKAGEVPASLSEIGAGILVAAAALVILSRAGAPYRSVVAACLVAFTGAELVGRHTASALNAEPADRYAVFQELPPEQLQGLKVLRQELAERKAKGDHPRIEILGLGGAWQNASMVLGLEDTIGYNPLRLADYERAVGPGENAADPNLRQFPVTFRGYKCRLANLLGLEYLVLDRPLERLPRHFPRLSGTVTLLYGSGQMWIYRLNTASPRVYVASRVTSVDSGAVLDEEELPEFDRTDEALVDEESLPLLTDPVLRDGLLGTMHGPDTARTARTARIIDYQRNAVVIEVETDRPGVVVLHDIFYPGWEVTVDGERRPVLRANLLFRGVEVSAGRHRIAFEFRPLSFDNLVAAAANLVNNGAGKTVEASAVQ
jgi:hypothetical protein